MKLQARSQVQNKQKTINQLISVAFQFSELRYHNNEFMDFVAQKIIQSKNSLNSQQIIQIAESFSFLYHENDKLFRHLQKLSFIYQSEFKYVEKLQLMKAMAVMGQWDVLWWLQISKNIKFNYIHQHNDLLNILFKLIFSRQNISQFLIKSNFFRDLYMWNTNNDNYAIINNKISQEKNKRQFLKEISDVLEQMGYDSQIGQLIGSQKQFGIVDISLQDLDQKIGLQFNFNSSFSRNSPFFPLEEVLVKQIVQEGLGWKVGRISFRGWENSKQKDQCQQMLEKILLEKIGVGVIEGKS
eukprot:TRINITY_DN15346_c0_g1_i1.p1 TRINITY_DN15346_c0_g1~~TRINITY_DN15346_c0_g1_i1.p1  ORF type:complete len:323 (-),score=28.90 TRINITY_DN15346_c0_g1_i1:52-945(-)